jgi:DNA-binding CsgD family transcriptional regulator
MTVTSSRECLYDLIASIYDCVLDPGNWQSTLLTVNREFGFANSVLGVVPLHDGAQVLSVAVGFDQEWLSKAGTYRADGVELWGGAERAQQFPLDEPILASQGSGYARRHTNRYFCEVLEPRGFIDALMIAIAREPGLLGYVAFNRHHLIGDIGEKEVSGLRVLAPHFRRAVTISNLFDLKAIEAATFVSALDSLSCGVVLVDSNLAIVHANAVAEGMFVARDPIRSEKGSLTLPVRVAHASLERAVLEAATNEVGLGQRGIGIPARRVNGEPCVIHVMPLRRGKYAGVLAQRASVALFVATTTAQPRMPSEAMALLYNLTPAETRIFEMISEGLTQDAIARALGIAASTVKTHLRHLFDKTGCQRQVDLVKLAASLSSPV